MRRIRAIALGLTLALMLAPLTTAQVAAQGQVVGPTDRTVLPRSART